MFLISILQEMQGEMYCAPLIHTIIDEKAQTKNASYREMTINGSNENIMKCVGMTIDIKSLNQTFWHTLL